MPESQARQRRPHGEVKNAMCEYFASRGGGPACIREIKNGIRDKVGDAPDSSYHSALKDERYFERVELGVFKFRDG